LSVAFKGFIETAAFSIKTGMRDSKFSLKGRVPTWAMYVGAFEDKAVDATFQVDDDPEWRRKAEEFFGRADWCGSLIVEAGVLPIEVPANEFGSGGQIAPIQIYVRTPSDSWRSLLGTCRAAYAAGHGIIGSFDFWWPVGSKGSDDGCFLQNLDVSRKYHHPIFRLSLTRSPNAWPRLTEDD